PRLSPATCSPSTEIEKPIWARAGCVKTSPNSAVPTSSGKARRRQEASKTVFMDLALLDRSVYDEAVGRSGAPPAFVNGIGQGSDPVGCLRVRAFVDQMQARLLLDENGNQLLKARLQSGIGLSGSSLEAVGSH